MGKVTVRRDKFSGTIRASLTQLASVVGQAAAEDLAAEARKNLQGGTGGTGLSTAGYNRPVRRSSGFSHVATGATLQSIQVVRTPRGRGFTHRVTVGGAALVLNNGRPPGLPVDVSRIEGWLAAKGIRARSGTGRRSALARKIASQIQARGMAPTFFFTDAVNLIRRRVSDGRYNKKGGAR